MCIQFTLQVIRVIYQLWKALFSHENHIEIHSLRHVDKHLILLLLLLVSLTTNQDFAVESSKNKDFTGVGSVSNIMEHQ